MTSVVQLVCVQSANGYIIATSFDINFTKHLLYYAIAATKKLLLHLLHKLTARASEDIGLAEFMIVDVCDEIFGNAHIYTHTGSRVKW